MTLKTIQPSHWGVRRVPKFRIMTKTNRNAAYHMLKGMLKDNALPRGALTVVWKHFSVDRRTISRLWKSVRNRVQKNHNEVELEGDEENQENDNNYNKEINEIEIDDTDR